mmetsp:Transcript_14874/g.41193  ORF Transcript_14874/g.41193 Transcript_14874/m.41193 type:complete len:149 (-) Transcript_14874:94-540(-)
MRCFSPRPLGSGVDLLQHSQQVVPQQQPSAASSLLQQQQHPSPQHFLSQHFMSQHSLTPASLSGDPLSQQQQQQQQQDRKRQAQTAAPTSAAPNDPKRLHKLISRRFKELRSQGVPSKEAMVQAQAQYQDQQTHMDAGSQVAAMFGMR